MKNKHYHKGNEITLLEVFDEDQYTIVWTAKIKNKYCYVEFPKAQTSWKQSIIY